MKAIVARQPGGPDVLQITDTVRPIVAAHALLIRVQAAGVNRPDVLQRKGQYPPPPGASPLVATRSVSRRSPRLVSPSGRTCSATVGWHWASRCWCTTAIQLAREFGAPYFERNLRSLAIDGRLVEVATQLGAIVDKLDLLQVMRKRLVITGSTMRPRTTAEKGAIAAAFRRPFAAIPGGP